MTQFFMSFFSLKFESEFILKFIQKLTHFSQWGRQKPQNATYYKLLHILFSSSTFIELIIHTPVVLLA